MCLGVHRDMLVVTDRGALGAIALLRLLAAKRAEEDRRNLALIVKRRVLELLVLAESDDLV